MKLLNLCLGFNALVVLLTLMPTVVNAALVQGVAQGVISDNAEVWGQDVDIFGLDGADLSGQSFIVNFTYDTSFAPLPTELGPDDITGSSRTTYESIDSNNWLQMSITVNDHTFTVEGDQRIVDILDHDITHPFSIENPGQTDFIHIVNNGRSGVFPGNNYRRQFLNIDLTMPDDILLSSSALLDFQTSNIIQSESGFLINELDLDPVTGEVIYQRRVGFHLDVQSVEVKVVPIPAAVWLFISGLLSLVYFTKKQ